VSGDSVEARVAPERSIYAKAIDIIADRGWWQDPDTEDPYGGTGPGGEVCINRALIATAHPCAKEAVERLTLAIGFGPTDWNDAPERTLEDVVLLLKYADADELDTWKSIYGAGSLSDETPGAAKSEVRGAQGMEE
jgi:hypothetical protein